MIPPLFDISAAPDLARWVSTLVRQESFFSPGDRVLVAVSGGPDSVALLHLLVRTGKELSLDLGVGHFDHGLRGRDSDDDAAFVAHLAQELGLPFHLGLGDVRREARERKISLQMAARELRLNFLRETCRSQAYHKLALGHTADDQVEQFFLRLLRGAGLQGLKGMLFTTPDGLVRPLLAVGKEVILAWLEREGLPYREDASNLNRRYLRNRVRLELLPELARQYNPQVKTAVWRLMSLLQEDERLLASQTAQAWNRVGRMVTRDLAAIYLPNFLALPAGLQKRTLRHALETFIADQEIISTQVENLLALAKAQRSGGQINFKECQVARAGQELHIWRRLSPPGDTVTVLSAMGECTTPCGWRFLLSLDAYPGYFSQTPSPGTVCLDGEQVRMPLSIRYFQPGDRFWPHGGPGTRKLQDFWVDNKIPRWLRPHIPLVLSDGQIIWVMGLRLAEPVKVTPTTKEVLSLKVLPTNPYTARVWEMLLAWQSQANSGRSHSEEDQEKRPFGSAENLP